MEPFGGSYRTSQGPVSLERGTLGLQWGPWLGRWRMEGSLWALAFRGSGFRMLGFGVFGFLWPVDIGL